VGTFRRYRLSIEVTKHPCDIISKLFVVCAEAILQFPFFEGLSPPICEHDDIEEAVDARGVEGIPASLDLARDFTTFERSPRGLDEGPPNEDRICKVHEGPLPLCVVGEVSGAGPGRPLADLGRSLGSGERPVHPRFVIKLEADVVEKNFAETRVLDFAEIGEYIHRSSPLPVMEEESRNTVRVDVVGQYWGRGNGRFGGGAGGVELIAGGFGLGRRGFDGVGRGPDARTRNTLTEGANRIPRNAGRLEIGSLDRHGDVVRR
jgi:hypothetical protein